MAFFNALAVPLFALVPGISVRYPAVALGIGGILFTAAGIRSIWSSPATTRQRVRQLGLVVALLLIFGTQLTAGAILLVESRRSIPLELICLALVASLLVGVARAWELVGARDTGIIASLAVLSRHAPGPARLTRLPGAGLAGATADGGPARPQPADHGGDGHAALRLYQGLLPDRERVLGPGHPGTLTTHAEIAHWGQLAARL